MSGSVQNPAHEATAPHDPPRIDGLVPLRAGRVHWAGYVLKSVCSIVMISVY